MVLTREDRAKRTEGVFRLGMTFLWPVCITSYSSTSLSNEMNEVGNVRVSDRNLLIPHRRAGLHFCREYQDWTMEQWRQVSLTDGSRVSLRGPGGREILYLRTNNQFAQYTIANTVGYTVAQLWFGEGYVWGANWLTGHCDRPKILGGHLATSCDAIMDFHFLARFHNRIDLNSIEYLWVNLKQRIRRRVPAPTNLQDLEVLKSVICFSITLEVNFKQ